MVVAVKFVRCMKDTLINKLRFKTQQEKDTQKDNKTTRTKKLKQKKTYKWGRGEK